MPIRTHSFGRPARNLSTLLPTDSRKLANLRLFVFRASRVHVYPDQAGKALPGPHRVRKPAAERIATPFVEDSATGGLQMVQRRGREPSYV